MTQYNNDKFFSREMVQKLVIKEFTDDIDYQTLDENQKAKNPMRTQEGFTVMENKDDFNHAFTMERIALENWLTEIPNIFLGPLNHNMEVTPLPTNQARTYQLQDKTSFTIYSPRRAECMLFCSRVLDEESLLTFKIIAAKAVKHGAQKTKTRESMVSVGLIHEEGDIEKIISKHMTQNDKPILPITQKQHFNVHCYCNDIHSKYSKDLFNCSSCKSRYHQHCRTLEERKENKCIPCSAPHTIAWGKGVTNTCPLDSTWQGMLLLIHETNPILPYPNDLGHKTFKNIMTHFLNKNDAAGQKAWYNYLTETEHKKSLCENSNPAKPNQANDCFGSPLDIVWGPLKAGGEMTYTNLCTNDKCGMTITKTNTNSINIVPDNDYLVDNLQDLIQIKIDGEAKHGRGNKCTKCENGNLVQTGHTFVNSKNAWFVNLEGSTTGLSVCDDQEKLMKLKNITIDGIEFEPRIIVSWRGNHFISLIKFQNTWLTYDDMGIEYKLIPASSNFYEQFKFDHMTFIRIPKAT